MIQITMKDGKTYQVEADKVFYRVDGLGMILQKGVDESVAGFLHTDDIAFWSKDGAVGEEVARRGGATSKQRGYLAVLIEQNPKLDCGVNPDDPDLTITRVSHAINYLKGTHNQEDK